LRGYLGRLDLCLPLGFIRLAFSLNRYHRAALGALEGRGRTTLAQIMVATHAKLDSFFGRQFGSNHAAHQSRSDESDQDPSAAYQVTQGRI
jgi:hypothetical protein